MLVRGVAIFAPAQIAKLFVSMGMQILVARLLLPEGRGLYGVCLAIAAVLLISTYFGNEFGVRHLLFEKRITPPQALRYLVITAALSWVAALTVVFLIVRSGVWLPEGITWPLLLLACTLAFSQLVTTQINVIMTLSGKFAAAASLAVGEELLKLALVSTLLLRHPSVETALLALLLGTSLTAVASASLAGWLKSDPERLQLEHFREIYGYGVRSVWLNLSSMSTVHIGTLVLSGLMANAQIGIYNLASALVSRLQVIPDALNRVLVPASMASDRPDDRFRMMRLSVTGLAVFSLGVAPFVATFSRPAIQIMFGHEYVPAAPLVIVLFVGFACKIIGKPLEAHFIEISGEPTVLGFIHVFSMITMCLLTHLGAIEYGLLGATVGSALSLILSAILLLTAYLRMTGTSFGSLFDFGPLLSRLLELRR